MKESPTDEVTMGAKVPADGWHLAKFNEGIDYLPAGSGKEGYFQNEKGFRTLKLPCQVSDPEDPDNEGYINVLVNMENGQKIMSGILKCVGLWDAVEKRFPGKDVTVFDNPVIEGIKVKLPGLSCMIKTEIGGKNMNNANARKIVSFARYKEIAAKEKGDAQTKKNKGPVQEAIPEAEGKDW